MSVVCVFFFQAEDGIRDYKVTGVQTCALPIFGADPERGARHAPHPPPVHVLLLPDAVHLRDRKSTRLNSSHLVISYAVFCLKKKKVYCMMRISTYLEIYYHVFSVTTATTSIFT